MLGSPQAASGSLLWMPSGGPGAPGPDPVRSSLQLFQEVMVRRVDVAAGNLYLTMRPASLSKP